LRLPLRSIALKVVPLLFSTLHLAAQTAAQIHFTYENPKLEPHKYVLVVGEDGSGNFHSEGSGVSADGQSMSSGSMDRPIHVSKAIRESMFGVARKNKFFVKGCDDGGKNIAFQGTKTLRYQGPDGQGTCIYNWSKNAQIGKLTDQFEAIAATLDEGSKLQRQYEHGRLSLDSEMETLDQMVHEGLAIEIENIAPLLQTLAGDEAVLQRVQRRAKTLLEAAPSD
jgi:hypothetical protein